MILCILLESYYHKHIILISLLSCVHQHPSAGTRQTHTHTTNVPAAHTTGLCFIKHTSVTILFSILPKSYHNYLYSRYYSTNFSCPNDFDQAKPLFNFLLKINLIVQFDYFISDAVDICHIILYTDVGKYPH